MADWLHRHSVSDSPIYQLELHGPNRLALQWQQYLRNQDNIPLRRILARARYGATHPDAPNTDPEGRELNRRVDVKLIVNKGLQSL